MSIRFLSVLCLILPAAAFAQSAADDPLVSSLERDWGAMNTAMIHVAESNLKVLQAYKEQHKAAIELEAYWKTYVAGLSTK
jgi:hypothetical protein